MVRTYSAGVHFGILEEILSPNHKCIRLSNSRRLWSWSGALSLSEVASTGINVSASKISVPVDEIILTEAIEIIPVHQKSNLPGNEHKARKTASA